MNGKKEFLMIKGEMIEIVVAETSNGEYIAAADYPGLFATAFIASDHQKALNMCVERLIKEKYA
jgi:hypothetical protein